MAIPQNVCCCMILLIWLYKDILLRVQSLQSNTMIVFSSIFVLKHLVNTILCAKRVSHKMLSELFWPI